MNLSSRLGLVAFLTLAASFALLASVMDRMIDRSYADLKEARLTFGLFSLRSSIESSLDLGLQLADLAQIQDLIEREEASSAVIQAIDISDGTGVSVLSTERGVIGDTVPDSWRRAQAERQGPFWRATDRGETVLGAPIETDFGQVAAQIALIVPTAELDGNAVGGTHDRAAVFLGGLAVALLAGAIGVAVARLASRPFAAEERSLSMTSPALRSDPRLAAAAAAALATTAAAAAALSEAEAQLTGIDAEI